MKIRVRIRFVILHILLILLAVVGGVFITFLWLDGYTRHGESFVVPDVSGLYYTDADVALHEQHMRSMVIDSIYVEDMSGGVVVDQVPQAGSEVKEGRTIYLTVNALYPRKVAIPELNDLSFRQAEAILKGLGFPTPHIVYWNSEYKDLVLSVSALGSPVFAGDKLPLTTQLTLAVGNGMYAPTRKTVTAHDTVSVAPDTLPSYDEILDPEY